MSRPGVSRCARRYSYRWLPRSPQVALRRNGAACRPYRTGRHRRCPSARRRPLPVTGRRGPAHDPVRLRSRRPDRAYPADQRPRRSGAATEEASRAWSAGTRRSRLRQGPRQAAGRHRTRRGAFPDGHRPHRDGAAVGDRRLRVARGGGHRLTVRISRRRSHHRLLASTRPEVAGSGRRWPRQATRRSGMAAPPATFDDRLDSCALAARPARRIHRNGACQRAGYRRDR